ncbi:MAG: SDR family oxidoreductase [Candidatus Tectomicrobia bacterium]|nr:SDR family oxidoreductase [Candidatus Tectomicrobia bacterium]
MNEVMVITGTRKGIGRYLVDYYTSKGFTVAGCSRSAPDYDASGVAEPGHYDHYCLDVSNESAVKQMVMDVYKKYKRLDILINNAGIASMNHSVLTPMKTVHSIFSTNVFGSFLCAREASKMMIKQKYGRIVNFATVATPLKLEGEATYAASKAAVKSYTEILAKELAAFNITVNAVGPTPVQTDLIKNVPEAKIQALIASQAVKRLGEYRDISNAVDFFISPESDFITGQTIYLGGIS